MSGAGTCVMPHFDATTGRRGAFRLRQTISGTYGEIQTSTAVPCGGHHGRVRDAWRNDGKCVNTGSDDADLAHVTLMTRSQLKSA